MNNKLIITILFLVALAAIAGCTTEKPIETDENYTFILKTYGGFTTPEENVYEFVITENKATLTVSGYDGTIARVEVANMTTEEYASLKKAFLDNDFKTLDSEYEPVDVQIADAANADITMKSENYEKTVTLKPYVPSEYNRQIQNIAEAFKKIEMKFWN